MTKSRKRLRDFTFTFHFYALQKEMAAHSSVLAWRIPGTGEPAVYGVAQSRTRLKRLSSSSSTVTKQVAGWGLKSQKQIQHKFKINPSRLQYPYICSLHQCFYFCFAYKIIYTIFLGFSCGSAGKGSACNVGDLGWEIPWRRERLPTPGFWSGEFHRLSSTCVLSCFSRVWLFAIPWTV